MKNISLRRLGLALPPAVLLMSLSLFGCKEEATYSEMVYTAGFDEFNGSSAGSGLTPLEEMAQLQNIFYSELDISSSPFQMSGSAADCDAKVKTACDRAVARIRQQTWQSTFAFQVYNAITQQVVYRYTYPETASN